MTDMRDVTPPVTVIISTNVDTRLGETLEDRLYRTLDGPVLEAIHSIEQQNYPAGRMDLFIARNVYGFTELEMHLIAAKQATTPWLAFVNEHRPWERNLLEVFMATVINNQLDRLTGATATFIIDRETFIKENS